MAIHEGEIQWGTATAAWDGENYFVFVKSFVHSWPCQWLQEHLAAALQDALDTDEIEVDIAPATPIEGGWEPAEWRLGPFETADPIEVIRKTTDEAVTEANSRAIRAEQDVIPWLNALRVWPNNP